MSDAVKKELLDTAAEILRPKRERGQLYNKDGVTERSAKMKEVAYDLTDEEKKVIKEVPYFSEGEETVMRWDEIIGKADKYIDAVFSCVDERLRAQLRDAYITGFSAYRQPYGKIEKPDNPCPKCGKKLDEIKNYVEADGSPEDNIVGRYCFGCRHWEEAQPRGNDNGTEANNK